MPNAKEAAIFLVMFIVASAIVNRVSAQVPVLSKVVNG
jgi:hypothetical protein